VDRIPLYNCTSHSQSGMEDIAKQCGFEFVDIEPMINTNLQNRDDQIRTALDAARKIPDKSCVLIGGAEIITETLTIELLKKNCRLYCYLYIRPRDKRNIKFSVKRIVETLWSQLYHRGEVYLKEVKIVDKRNNNLLV